MTVDRRRASDAGALDLAARLLADGQLVGLPTETVYGIAALPAPDALERLVHVKGRDPAKGIALLVDGLRQVEPLVVVTRAASRLAAAFWPGPLTIVLPLRAEAALPELLTGGRRTLGVRVPDHVVPRTLAARLGPLAVSSANRTGEPDARSADELVLTVGGDLSLVLDDGPVRGGVPSTVLLVESGGDGADRVTVLRAGAIPESEARQAAGTLR